MNCQLYKVWWICHHMGSLMTSIVGLSVRQPLGHFYMQIIATIIETPNLFNIVKVCMMLSQKQLYAETLSPIIWMGTTCFGRVEI